MVGYLGGSIMIREDTKEGMFAGSLVIAGLGTLATAVALDHVPKSAWVLVPCCIVGSVVILSVASYTVMYCIALMCSFVSEVKNYSSLKWENSKLNSRASELNQQVSELKAQLETKSVGVYR
jgi:hypothetical protein